MARKLSVELDALRASATAVRGHGDDLSTSHMNADRRVTSAGTGWRGNSAQALTTFAAKMNGRAAATVNQIDDHSSHMHGAVDSYGSNERDGAREMAELDEAGRDAARRTD